MSRRLTTKEEKKYGCKYCLHKMNAHKCKFDKCPYKKDLEGFNTYEDYFKEQEKGINIENILKL